MHSVFDPLLLGSAALEVLSAAQQTPQQIAALQARRLAQLLVVASRGSALYRRLLHGCDPAGVALHELPVTHKAELMRHFDDWVTDPRLQLASLRAFTADRRRIADTYLDRYIVWESSGTGGAPGIFVQDAQTLATYDALEALRRSTPRAWQRLLDPMLVAERIAFIVATTGHFASQVSAQRLRRLNPWLANTMRSFSILQPAGDLVQQLNAFKPSIIVTYPTAAALLAEEARSGRLFARPREIWTGGETLSPAMRERLRHSFGCAVRNSYGASEFLPIGWECALGRMHANTDWVLIEPVDARHRPVPPGELSHSTLITHLGNFVQPLIRYDLGDQIRVMTQRCRCGSPFPVIEVQGRRDEPLQMEGRDGRPVTLLPLALTTVLEDEAQVFDFQLQQRDARTLVLKLPSRGDTAEHEQSRCREALQNFARRHGLAPISVVVQTGQRLTHGRSGKLPRVVAVRARGASRRPIGTEAVPCG
ncbi:phenylacetate--CoA ligase family protein [Piscinibacter sp.]|uniref:phenylacetate--CoA ligase family protein n=1 Tax=Piscinibacter sp. TaxID=1903157 RepID=UPI002BAC803B|nr:AMP-binding protein [Albitalea sp.]HUG21470.1 AMP-binding protein [Albitalea sp.]